jgi:Protein of unknown function (DUF2591)
MFIKTSELTGPALDWAVAKLEGDLVPTGGVMIQTWPYYATNWAHGGPIIERADISVYSSKAPEIGGRLWVAFAKGINAEGPTPLIAAMRCYVASKLGDEIDIPEGLTP